MGRGRTRVDRICLEGERERGESKQKVTAANLTFAVIMTEVGEVSKVMIHGLQMNYFLPALFCPQSPFQYDSQN